MQPAEPFWRRNALLTGALLVYLLTRLIGLADWPIYFFTDEAVQTTMAADFLRDGLRNYQGELLPTYFSNGASFNLSSVSVYLQALPYRIFGPSVFGTRAVSALVSLLAAWAVGRSLQQVFHSRLPWLGVLALTAIPAWFLHSRTAFETVEMSAFYAGFLYFYLRYRSGAVNRLYPALVCGALAFYTYSPAQLIIPVTAGLFLLLDLPYHWQQRRTVLQAGLLLLLLVAPYGRYLWQHPQALGEQLAQRAPFWAQTLPWSEKLARFGSLYLSMFDPRYWFSPQPQDLARHLMKGYGHLALWSAPLLLVGLWVALRRSLTRAHPQGPAYRLLLLAMLAAPLGSALVGRGITRLLLLCIPFAILISLGLEEILNLLLYRNRVFSKTPARPSLPLQGREGGRGDERGPLSPLTPAGSLILFGLLSALCLYMLGDALLNGPLWYRDYGLSGMQYGARQLDQAVRNYLGTHPDARLIVSPSWANGADTTMRFFWLPGLQPYRFGSVEGHIFERLPLDENTAFVMLPHELELARQSGKFSQITVERTLPYPDGQTGFYFVHLSYVPNLDEILAAERDQRRQLEETELVVAGLPATVRHSRLDIGSASQLFDGDPNSLTRTLEANPYVIEIIFKGAGPTLSGLSAITGSANVKLEVTLEPSAGAAQRFSANHHGRVQEPETQLDFGQPIQVQRLRLELSDLAQGEPGHIHIWELKWTAAP